MVQAIQTTVRVPSGRDFRGQDGEKRDFLPADALSSLSETLQERHPQFAHVAQFKVLYLWKRAGGKSNGKPKLGQCQKPSGLLRHVSDDTDFVIWLAADHCATFTARQVEAALFHELSHIGTDEDDEAEVWPHDVEMFASEVQTYGLWKSDLEMAARALRQARLPGLDVVG